MIKVGTFGLGVLGVTVMVDPELEGGNYVMHPTPTITIGLKGNSFPEVLGILLHESLEMAHMVRGHKFRSVPMSSYDSADVTFIYQHSEHSRICADTGYFIHETVDKLAPIYKRLTNAHSRKRIRGK